MTRLVKWQGWKTKNSTTTKPSRAGSTVHSWVLLLWCDINAPRLGALNSPIFPKYIKLMKSMWVDYKSVNPTATIKKGKERTLPEHNLQIAYSWLSEDSHSDLKYFAPILSLGMVVGSLLSLNNDCSIFSSGKTRSDSGIFESFLKRASTLPSRESRW